MSGLVLVGAKKRGKKPMKTNGNERLRLVCRFAQGSEVIRLCHTCEHLQITSHHTAAGSLLVFVFVFVFCIVQHTALLTSSSPRVRSVSHTNQEKVRARSGDGCINHGVNCVCSTLQYVYP